MNVGGVDGGVEMGRPVIEFIKDGVVIKRVLAARAGYDEVPEELPLGADTTSGQQQTGA